MPFRRTSWARDTAVTSTRRNKMRRNSVRDRPKSSHSNGFTAVVGGVVHGCSSIWKTLVLRRLQLTAITLSQESRLWSLIENKQEI